MNWLRRWLGLDMIQDQLDYQNRAIDKLYEAVTYWHNDIVVQTTDEFDSTRRNLSTRIAQIKQTREQAEDWARRHTLGEV